MKAGFVQGGGPAELCAGGCISSAPFRSRRVQWGAEACWPAAATVQLQWKRPGRQPDHLSGCAGKVVVLSCLELDSSCRLPMLTALHVCRRAINAVRKLPKGQLGTQRSAPPCASGACGTKSTPCITAGVALLCFLTKCSRSLCST